MGIIRAAVNAVHGSLADQWLETVEPYEMGEHTVFTEGILVRKGQNKKGSQTISNGSVIHVYDNQFMMLVDGGKIIDYTAEPGYFTVDQSSSPSMFSGSLDAAVKDTFERLKFGGQTPHVIFNGGLVHGDIGEGAGEGEAVGYSCRSNICTERIS